MKPSVPPHMVVLLILTSLSPLGAESPAKPTASSFLNRSETSVTKSFSLPVTSTSDAAIMVVSESFGSIPRAIPVVTAAPRATLVIDLEVRREPVSFHPITVKNGPQPYVIDPDSLQKGLALVSELYRKSGSR